jgi:hypothetical protein
LFIGEQCRLALTDDVVLDEAARTITFKGWKQVSFFRIVFWRIFMLQGVASSVIICIVQVDVFRLPGSPHTPVFTGHTVLTLDPKENIVVEHIETWDQKPDEVSSKIKFFDNSFNPGF